MSDRDVKPENPEPRMDKVREAQWRIKMGYYEMPEIQEEAADRLTRALEKATQRRSTNSGDSRRSP